MKNSIIYFRRTGLLIITLQFVCQFFSAQNITNAAADTSALIALNGYTQQYFYSKVFVERAKNIAEFMEQAGSYFQEEIKFTPKIILYILAPEDWKSFAAKPLRDVYGFPHNIDGGHLAIAAADNDFWKSYLPVVDQLPIPLAQAVKKAYGKSDETYSMMPFFDLLALHEMGHSYTSQAGLKMQRHWMGELFVNIMLHTYVAEKQPTLLPALETFPNMVLGAGTAEFKFTSLSDFERLYTTLGMGPKNYGWYQCKLHAAAKDIYNAAGKTVLKKLWEALKKHQEEMTDTEFVNMLKVEVDPAVANVFLDWDQVK